MSLMVDDTLVPDTGRPDTRELARVIARAVAEARGQDLDGLGSDVMAPVGTVHSTPRSARELVPGDIEGIGVAASGLTMIALAGLPSAGSDMAAHLAGALSRLRTSVARLRGEAESVFQRSHALGIGDRILSDPSALERLSRETPEAAAELQECLRGAIDLRLEWVDAQGEFIDDLQDIRIELGIPPW